MFLHPVALELFLTKQQLAYSEEKKTLRVKQNWNVSPGYASHRVSNQKGYEKCGHFPNIWQPLLSQYTPGLPIQFLSNRNRNSTPPSPFFLENMRPTTLSYYSYHFLVTFLSYFHPIVNVYLYIFCTNIFSKFLVNPKKMLVNWLWL